MESSSAPSLCDIDGDGDLDLFVGHGGGKIWFYRNDGTLQEPVWTFVTDQFGGIDIYYGSATPKFVDIDADGDFDLFIGVSSWWRDNIRFYENVGTPFDAVWLEHEDFMLYLDFGSQIHPEMVDIDADEDLDIFAGAGGVLGGGTDLLRNDGTPYNPQWTIEYTQLPTNTGKFCDIDNDGDFDLFFHSIVQEAFVFYENIGTPQEGEWVLADPQFIPYEVDWSVGAAAPTNKIDFADIDADGDYDFFVGTYDFEYEVLNGGRLWYSENTGTPEEPEFDMPWYYTNIDVGNSSYLTLADVDGDGDYDLLMRGFATESLIYYFENLGSIWEPEWVEITDDFLGLSDDYGLIYAFGDLDGNETNDLVIGGIWGGLQLYSNGGPLNIDNDQDYHNPHPEQIKLSQNYPNPFNSRTRIGYKVTNGESRITLSIYTVLGEEVVTLVDEVHNQGEYEAVWDGRNRLGKQASSGVYIYRLHAKRVGSNQTVFQQRKLVFLQ